MSPLQSLVANAVFLGANLLFAVLYSIAGQPLPTLVALVGVAACGYGTLYRYDEVKRGGK